MVDIRAQLEKLKSRDPGTRYDACKALERALSLPREAVEALRQATCDADPVVAEAAYSVLHGKPLPASNATVEPLGADTSANPLGKASGCAGFAIALLIMLVGAGGMFAAGWHLAERLGLGREMVRTNGTVVDIRTTSEDGEIFAVEVVTEKGTFKQEMSCGLLACFGAAQIGMRVPVIYPRDAPGMYGAILPDSPQGWLGDLGFLGLASIMAVGAMAYLASFGTRRT